MLLDKDLKIRYSRQISVKEIGYEGQQRLCEGKVLIIGCGALGSMIAMQLAGAGVGTIGIVDFDNIEVSNLQRQFFYTTSECGRPKSEMLEKKILTLNQSVKVNRLNKFFTAKDAAAHFPDYDFIIDATDNPDSKRLIDEMARENGKPCCIGGVRDFSGQVTTLLPEDPRFDEIFGVVVGDSFLPCSLGGVVGPAAAFCASIQASEAIKFLAKAGELLSGKILFFDLLKPSVKIFSV